MISRALSRLPWLSIPVAISLALSACAVHFGAAYDVEKQNIDVSYPAGAPGFASVRASYLLQNVGAIAISSFEVVMPDPRVFAVRGMQIQWGGQTVQPVPAHDSKVKFHLPLASNWQPHARNELTIAYDVRAGLENSEANARLNGPLFLPAGGWYPELHAPGGILTAGGASPKKWEVKVSVPSAYVVFSSGRERGHSRQNGIVEHRYDNSDPGYLPFVVAGAFERQDIVEKFGTVSLWSLAPMSAERARALVPRISSSVEYFRNEFGPRKPFSHDVRIIECPVDMGALSPRPWLATEGCVGVPGAAIVPEGFLSGAKSRFGDPGAADTIFSSIDSQLAATWFHFTARINSDAAMFPMDAAADYAAFSLEVSRNPASRASAVGRLLTRIPVESNPHELKSLASISRDATPEVLNAAFAKSELFFIALEDRCGAPQLHRSLARIVRILGGDTWTSNDLRSAAEAECGSDLGQFFRDWLDQQGIPAEFRAKYGSVSADAKR